MKGSPDIRPRYKVRFPDSESLRASQAAELPFLDVTVVNHRRSFIGVVPLVMLGVNRMPDAEEQLGFLTKEYGAEVVIDRQYAPGGQEGFGLPVGPEIDGSPSLDDILEAIRAREAWELARGAGSIIAIVDSGIAGSRLEFPQTKRRGQWSLNGRDAWRDEQGHGTMCACIAAATRVDGGEFDGVAPDASLLACRTTFVDSELTTIYDFLGDFAQVNGVPVIASNSWGLKTGQPPPDDPNEDFPDALEQALAAGVIAVFSAGNYHGLAGGLPDACSPTSIWQHKCRDDVVTVANSRPDGSMWATSSRGPGQYAGTVGATDKPDVNAPTPPDGRVLWGDQVASLPDGWGTSGACPQVAGLLALALSKGATDRQAIVEAITSTAESLGHDRACEGAGRIDCRAALEAL